MVAHRADQLSDDGVADEAGVAVLVGHDTGASGRDDERRVAHDEVEPFARDRVEQVPGPQVDRHLGQRRGEAGEGEGALGDVGRDDRATVPGEVQGLHPAAGAEVESPPYRRRGVHWATVIEAGPTPRTWSGAGGPPGDLGLVRDDPPVVGLVAVGAQVAERSRVTGAELDETQRPGPDRGQTGQGAVEVGRGDGHTEREATGHDGDRVGDPAGGQVRGQWLLPVERRVRDRPEEGADSVDRVAGAGQIRSEGGQARGVGARRRGRLGRRHASPYAGGDDAGPTRWVGPAFGWCG